MERSAQISPCGQYRYSLSRRWGAGPVVCWVMLNPSTADAQNDDPTIRRCIGFSQRWGYGALVVVNLFARRCTRPVHLSDPGDPVGPGNSRAILGAVNVAQLLVAAWGAHPLAVEPGRRMAQVWEPWGGLECLGTTKAGAPRHPLYVRADAERQQWRP